MLWFDGTKPLPEPVLTKISHAIWGHLATMIISFVNTLKTPKYQGMHKHSIQYNYPIFLLGNTYVELHYKIVLILRPFGQHFIIT